MTPFFLFNREILLLVGGGVAVVLIAVSVQQSYNYAYFEIPIKNAVLAEEFSYIIHVPVDQVVHPRPIESIIHNPEDDTITVAFREGFHRVASHEADFVETYSVNESFAFRCYESENVTYLTFFGYKGIAIKNGTEYLRLLHYDGITQEYMQCAYPEVIIHSRGHIPQTAP